MAQAHEVTIEGKVFLTVAGLAKMLGMAPASLRNRRSEGRPMPESLEVGRLILYPKAEAQEFARTFVKNARTR